MVGDADVHSPAREGDRDRPADTGIRSGHHAGAAGAAAATADLDRPTNFIRDVAEDLDRGRVYLPADELSAYGVDHDRLLWCRSAGRADNAVREAIADQVATTRAIYRRALPVSGCCGRNPGRASTPR